MNWRRVLGVLAVGLSAAWPGVAALAVEETITSRITRTLTATGGRWGGCMAQLQSPLSSEGLDCADSWVTFSCAGGGTPMRPRRTPAACSTPRCWRSHWTSKCR